MLLNMSRPTGLAHGDGRSPDESINFPVSIGDSAARYWQTMCPATLWQTGLFAASHAWSVSQSPRAGQYTLPPGQEFGWHELIAALKNEPSGQQKRLEHTPFAHAPQSNEPPHPLETAPHMLRPIVEQTWVGLQARILTGTVVVNVTLEARSFAFTWKL
jgi:hypothetical protein